MPKREAKPKGETVKTSLRLPAALWKRVLMASIQTDKFADKIVVEALEMWLAKQKEKP
jgi:hypothetical protein